MTDQPVKMPEVYRVGFSESSGWFVSCASIANMDVVLKSAHLASVAALEAEIDSLRVDKAALKVELVLAEQASQHFKEQYKVAMRELGLREAEIKRLRDAVELIANEDDESDEWDGTAKFSLVRDIARAALGSKP